MTQDVPHWCVPFQAQLCYLQRRRFVIMVFRDKETTPLYVYVWMHILQVSLHSFNFLRTSRSVWSLPWHFTTHHVYTLLHLLQHTPSILKTINMSSQLARRSISPNSILDRRSRRTSTQSTQSSSHFPFSLMIPSPQSEVSFQWCAESWPQSPSSHRQAIRRQPSLNEITQSEQHISSLLGLIEPRPMNGVVGGIEEMLRQA